MSKVVTIALLFLVVVWFPTSTTAQIGLLPPNTPQWVAEMIYEAAAHFGKKITKETLKETFQLGSDTLMSFFKSKDLTIAQLDELQGFVGRLNQIVTGSNYDLVVNATSLKTIAKGWEVEFHGSTYEEWHNTPFKGRSVGVFGPFDSGKTWVVNMLTGRQYAEGITQTTLGLSIAKVDKLLYFDCEGSKRTARDHLEDRLASDAFLQDMVIQLSDLLFYVVDALFVTEVPVINAIQSAVLKQSTASHHKSLVIVHNFVRYYEEEEVKRHIKDDIITAFNGEISEKPDGCHDYISHDGLVTHVIFANNNSSAGKIYNECGKLKVQEFVKGLKGFRQFNVLQQIGEVVEGLLPKYFFPPGVDPTSVPEVFIRDVEAVKGEQLQVAISPFSDFYKRAHKLAKSVILPDVTGEMVVSGAKKAFNAVLSFFSGAANAEPSVEAAPVKAEIRIPQDPFAVVLESAGVKTTFRTKNGSALHYTFEPSYDLYAHPEKWTLQVDMPGVNARDVSCPTPMVLRLQGIRTHDASLGKRVDTTRVRKYGYFVLDFHLPDWAPCSLVKPTAKFADGMLFITYSRVDKDEL